MGEDRSRLIAKVDDEKKSLAVRYKPIRSNWVQNGSVVVGMASRRASLGSWPIATLARAQDTQAKVQTQVQPDVAQEPVSPETVQDPAQGSAEALSVRYRFEEKYTRTTPSRKTRPTFSVRSSG